MKKIFIFLLVITQNICFSQQILTLPEAINIAIKNSPGIRIVKNNLSISTINNDYGIAGGLPAVQITGSDNQQSAGLNQSLSSGTDIQRKGVGSNAATVGLGASVPVYAGGRIQTEKKRLEQVESQSEQELTSRGLAVVSNVMLKYYDIVRQQNYAKTIQQSITVSQKKLDIIQSQKEVGMANNADLFQAQLDLNAQKQLLEAQQLIIEQDKTDLLTQLTLKTDSTITIVDTIIVDRNIQLDSILNNLYINPDVIAADKQIRINELLEREIYGLRYPAVNVNTGFNFNRTQSDAGNVLFNQSYGPYVGLNFSVPLFNGGIYKKEYQISTINTNNARLLKDTLILGYTSSVVKTWQSYTSNLRQLDTQQKNYDLSVQLVNLVLQRFQLRQATIIDVTLAQQTFQNAAYALVNISYAAKAAEIQLKKLANRLRF
jgi:outer membrane protein